MSRGNKWLDDVRTDQPVTEVGFEALTQRLEVVLTSLPFAAKRSEEDIEYVHQLRVSTRRAQGALHLFAEWLPRRRRSWWNRQLKQLRNAAGRARDLDVLIQRLERRQAEVADCPLQGIVEDLKRQRQQAQKPLRKLGKQWKRKRVLREIRGLIKRIRWRGTEREPNFPTAARQTLKPLVDTFFAAGSTDLTKPENLHEMRIVGKKLRYAIELLAQAFDSSLREKIYPQFCEIQEDLGDINDHLTAQQLFDGWLAQSDDCRTDGELSRLVTQEHAALKTAMEHFRQVWTPDAADQLRSRFERLLQPGLSIKRRKKTAKRIKRAMARA